MVDGYRWRNYNRSWIVFWRSRKLDQGQIQSDATSAHITYCLVWCVKDWRKWTVPFMGFIAFKEAENFEVMANSTRLSGSTWRLFDVERWCRIFGPFNAERITQITVGSFQISLCHSMQLSLTIISRYSVNESHLTPASCWVSLVVWYHLKRC